MATATTTFRRIPRDPEHLRLTDFLIRARFGDDVSAPIDDPETVRTALASPVGLSSLVSLVNVAFLEGYNGSPDSTVGWVRNVSLPNYLPAKATFNEMPMRVPLLPRGGIAATLAYGADDAQEWKLMRFSGQFALTEQDLLDGVTVQVYQQALRQAGAAVRRLVPDLVYSFILDNANLADGVALFATARGNRVSGGGSALQNTSLATAMGAIAGQTLDDDQGDPVHVNLSAKYLIVPGPLAYTARALAKLINIGDEGDLIVRSESRLGAAGVVDPRDDSIVTGSATNWLLTAPETQAAGVAVGYLDGKREPTVRAFELTGGQWGTGFDISFSIGVTAVDGRPLYFSVGA